MIVKINGKKIDIEANFDPKGVPNKAGDGFVHCATGWPKPSGLKTEAGNPIYVGIVVTSKTPKAQSGEKPQQA
jgi:hypothetical protein